MAHNSEHWQHIGIDSYLESGPDRIPAVSHHGDRLDLLPFHDLDWPDFERLQWRILRDVEGLRHAQFYGSPGQAQAGLDLVAKSTDGSVVALQSKRVKQFGASDITNAIDAFRTTSRAFTVSRFILGVSIEVRSTQAIHQFMELERELEPVELELWDQSELSERLKDRPAIVAEYFGADIAKIFCGPFEVHPRTVPSPDVVAIRQAIARTPEATTGAREKIAQAEDLAETHPNKALAMVEQSQADLTAAGFESHARQYDALRDSLLVKLGRVSIATRSRLDQLWSALDQGHTTSADLALHRIAETVHKTNGTEGRDHLKAAQDAVRLYSNPLASVPSLADLQAADIVDRARLAVLAGETALAAHDQTWLRESATELADLAELLTAGPANDTLRTRLRILSAEGSGQWDSILDDARRLQLSYELVALVQARHARHLALAQELIEADASWDEAAGSACLAAHWTDASRWVLSRRAFRKRWKPFTSDELLPVQTALSARGPDRTVLPHSQDALEYAYISLADGKLRPAAIAAQRSLRDAVTLSDWEGERRARRLLADILSASGEHLLAANHLVLAGEINPLKQLGAEHKTEFLDVTPHLSAQPWWVVGAAYRLIATQADLVPDEALPDIVGHILAELSAAQEGTLVDLRTYTGSRYLGAIAVLAGISERLSKDQAEQVMAFFESLPPVEENHYRHQDEDESKAVAGILTTHAEVTGRALPHLVALLSRSQSSRKQKALDAVTDRMSEARPLLEELADANNTWAQELLGAVNPEEADLEKAQEARARLEKPLEHEPGVFTVGSGSNAVSDSILLQTLPPRDQQAALNQLIERGADKFVPARDRSSYLLAASNLDLPPDFEQRHAAFERAIALTVSPPMNVADSIDEDHRHPLSTFRMLGFRDSRGEAAFLAAALAVTHEEKERVRSAALKLIGDGTVSEVWTTRALQRLGKTVSPDVGFLSGQNWALRSLSAILWSETTEPDPVGYKLAADPDARVRATLARNLTQRQAKENPGTAHATPSDSGSAERRREAREAVLAILREDPAHSVRTAATAPTGTDPSSQSDRSQNE